MQADKAGKWPFNRIIKIKMNKTWLFPEKYEVTSTKRNA